MRTRTKRKGTRKNRTGSRKKTANRQIKIKGGGKFSVIYKMSAAKKKKASAKSHRSGGPRSPYSPHTGEYSVAYADTENKRLRRAHAKAMSSPKSPKNS